MWFAGGVVQSSPPTVIRSGYPLQFVLCGWIVFGFAASMLGEAGAVPPVVIGAVALLFLVATVRAAMVSLTLDDAEVIVRNFRRTHRLLSSDVVAIAPGRVTIRNVYSGVAHEITDFT